MDIISNKKINFKSLEENAFKKVMKLGIEIMHDQLQEIDVKLYLKKLLEYSII